MPSLDAVGMVVKDMGAAVRFYSRLGLEFAQGWESEDHVEAVTPGGMRVMLDTEALMLRLVPEWTWAEGQDISLAFKCDSPEEVDALTAALKAEGHGVAAEPWDAFWGQRYAVVLDPDGRKVDLFAQLG
ncbi:MAG: VOC family protein [Fimbriimonadaceae bacterium]|nr:VOC family protein [Fimbriimonadaceae bacterium]